MEDVKKLSRLAWLIEALDGYRVGRALDPRMVEERLREFMDLFDNPSHVVKVVRVSMDRIVNLPARDPGARRWATVYMTTRLMLRVTVALFLLSALLAYRAPPTGLALLYASSALLYVALVLRWYSLNRVLDFYESNRSRFSGASRRLGEVAQDLIDHLREAVRRGAVRPSKVRLHLFNTDYRGIRVLRRPGVLRECYLCEVVP